MANRVSTRALTEAGLLAAITAVMALLGQVVPVLPLLIPVPIVLIAVRHGFRTALMTTAVVGLLLAYVLGPGAALFQTVSFGSVGLAIGWGATRRWEAGGTLLLTAAALLLTLALSLSISVFIAGVDIGPRLDEAVAQARTQIHQTLEEQQVLDTPQGQAQLAVAELFLDVFRRTWWAVFMVAIAPAALLYYAVARWSLRRFRYTLPPIPSFRDWHLPAETLLPLALGLGALLTPVDVLINLGLGVLVIMLYLYAFNGLSLTYGLLVRWGLPQVLAALLTVLAAVSVIPAVVIGGLLDSVFDFRLSLDSRE